MMEPNFGDYPIAVRLNPFADMLSYVKIRINGDSSKPLWVFNMEAYMASKEYFQNVWDHAQTNEGVFPPLREMLEGMPL